jgi:putative membrane protein insertion efficiency factor
MTGVAMVLRWVVRGYQLFISPLLPAACRFHPSCSNYAAEALAEHGTAKGLRLALSRLARCRPWGGWGYDPVPAKAAGRIADSR